MGNISVSELQGQEFRVDPTLWKSLNRLGINSREDLERRVIGRYPSWATGDSAGDKSDRELYVAWLRALSGEKISDLPIGGRDLSSEDELYKVLYEFLYSRLEDSDLREFVIHPYGWKRWDNGLDFHKRVEQELRDIYDSFGIKTLAKETDHESIRKAVNAIGDRHGLRTLLAYSEAAINYLNNYPTSDIMQSNLEAYAEYALEYIEPRLPQE